MNKIIPGLCSVSFRSLRPKEIVQACIVNGLGAIEWGGDVHAPHGDVRACSEIRQICEDEGVEIPSYGSYHRLDPSSNQPSFESVLDSALALGAKTIRVWGGVRGSRDMPPDYRANLVDSARQAGDLARAAGCQIGLEFHNDTITDTNESALAFIKEINHPAVKSYWQPSWTMRRSERLQGLEMILPWLCHLHVYHWIGDPPERRALSEGVEEWREYLQVAAKASGAWHAYLEFFKGDSLDALACDAVVFKKLLSSIAGA